MTKVEECITDFIKEPIGQVNEAFTGLRNEPLDQVNSVERLLCEYSVSELGSWL